MSFPENGEHGMQKRKRVNVLGIEIDPISLGEAVLLIAAWIEKKTLSYVNFCTVNTIMECFGNRKLKHALKGGLTAPDGMPLVWLCRYYGHRDAVRVYGPDFMLAFCKYSEGKGYQHFFYGGAPGIAEDLADELKRRFPNIEIAGTHAPPFRKIGDMEVSSVIESINASGADIIWVGLGTPKQDLWIAQHRHLLKAPVLAAVGAAFDFHTGRSPQAPYWMQRSGLEWLFRLINEPRRLAFRYLVYNPIFILLVILQLTGLRKYHTF